MAVSTDEVTWLVSHLQAVVAASPAAWAGKGMTLLQLTALHLISAQEPVTLTDLAQDLGTGLPATSAMVKRLTCIGLVCSAPDPQNRRCIQLTITARANQWSATSTCILPNVSKRCSMVCIPRFVATLSTCSGNPYNDLPANTKDLPLFYNIWAVLLVSHTIGRLFAGKRTIDQVIGSITLFQQATLSWRGPTVVRWRMSIAADRSVRLKPRR